MNPLAPELVSDLELLDGVVADTVAEQAGAAVLALIAGIERDALALRAGTLVGGRDCFAERVAALELDALEELGGAATLRFLLVNAAEEQQRIRVLRRRDRLEQPPEGSLAAACAELARVGTPADAVRAMLGRLFVMPVLTAHPTEARRRTVIELLTQVGGALDRLDDPRPGARQRRQVTERLREVVLTLYTTEPSRSSRPTPLDEVRAALNVFESTLFEVTPLIYRELEDALATAWPGERFAVGPFLRWGTWIGGDRDGNPNVTANVTRIALGRQRRLVLRRHMADVDALGRELSVSVRRAGPMAALERSIADDQARLPEIAARARRRNPGERVGEKLGYVLARLEATLADGEASYPGPAELRADLDLVDASLRGARLARLADGRLRDVRRRVEVFGFHLATLDVRQHSAVHERAVTELLRVGGGAADYTIMSEEGRIALLARLLERAELGAPHDRAALSPETRELLATIDVVARARREQGPEACERYVISFTAMPSDVLEVLFLLRAARLAPDEIRPVPLFEQLEDLERAATTTRRLLELRPFTVAIRGELEVMIGYSDSSKQAGYVASQVALRRAQQALAAVADEHGVVLTVFHGRGGAVGRGGGPASRAIRSQPHEALRGRLRVTEQGETIAARYGRAEIARRDLEQMVSAVLLGTAIDRRPPPAERAAAEAVLDRAATAARAAYDGLVADRERLARYALAATPIQVVAELPIASRPAARRAGLSFDDLRAIPWVFSWNQSRHGLPGWFGLGAALDAVAPLVGVARLRALYRDWPAFAALIDNAQVALVRSDIDVAGHYARLADEEDRSLYRVVQDEHARTVARVLEITAASEVLAGWPTVQRTVERRNPYVDVLSHVQIELLRRLSVADAGAAAERIRAALFVTINGIAAGLQTAG